MEGVGSERETRNPCIHAATKFPAVQNNAACGQLKSIEKLRISTVFLGFFAISADFRRFFAGFARFGSQKPAPALLKPLAGLLRYRANPACSKASGAPSIPRILRNGWETAPILSLSQSE
jgi:hypothetical protein